MSRSARAVFVLQAAGRTIPLAPGSYVVGRVQESDIVFEDDPKISRRHVRLVVSEDAVEVEDLGSTNGTWVDAYLVQHRLRVTRSSRLRMGSLEALLEPAAGKLLGHPAARTTTPDIGGREPESDQGIDITTEQTAGFEYVRTALVEMIGVGNLEQAKRTLDPVLETVELSTRALDVGALDTAAELALRLALALHDPAYVDAAVRVHCAHASEMTEDCIQLLETCIGEGLEPDPRNAEAYLASLGQGFDASAARAKRARLEAALTAPHVTLPAPGPGSAREPGSQR